jgi:TolB-like protein/Flp pilus assembly protein TadD
VTDPGKAVFLSYASQDAEAAGRICKALQAAGIEVWFDQSELRGGDAWDQQIRHQIRDCALFVPIISAHTQARPEGYFRLEWKLAVDRSHLMAAEKAFLVPVVVDATTEPEALVPAQFRDVQWTRIRAGEVPAAFVDHIAALLNQPVAPHVGSQERGVSRSAARRLPIVLIALSVAAAVTLVIATAMRGGWLSQKPVPKVEASTATTPAATTQSPVSEKSVAVLPFVDMSENHDQGYFADGMAEELIDLLAKTQGLHVIARTSSFSFKGKSDDIPTIASKLKVSHLLEGSVRKAGGHLRVTTQLVRADTGEHVWSESYDREDKDVFRVQDEIAESVVSALKVKLSAPLTLEGSRGTKNLEAYYQFLLGRQYFTRIRIDDLKRAVAAYTKATELDPTYAAAYAELAVAQVYLTGITGDERGRDEVEATADRAVQLAPGRAEGYSARGWVRQVLKWDWAGAEEDLRRAVALDPTDSRTLYRLGWLLGSLGRTQEAIECTRRAIDLDPLANENWRELSRLYVISGDYSAARAAINRALEIEPRDPYSQAKLGDIELLESHYEAASQIYRKIELDSAQELGIAMAEHALGHEAVADAALHSLIAKHATTDAYQIAQVYAWRNERAQALDWLERAYRQRDGGLEGIKTDPLLTNIRTEPRYRALLHKLKLA